MCYTAKDSLNAYIINLISSFLLFFNTSDTDFKIISMFFLFVGQMQMFDYLFWTNKECNKTNKYVTRTAIIFNHLQPVILFLLLNFYEYQQNPLALISIILYSVFAIQYTIKIWPDENCQVSDSVCCSLPHNPDDKDQVINWQWNHQPSNRIVYALFLIYLTFGGLSFKNNKLLFVLLNLGSFFISTKIPKLNQSVGRIWCYMASLMPGFLLVYDKMIK
jgi:hypothetical protein